MRGRKRQRDEADCEDNETGLWSNALGRKLSETGNASESGSAECWKSKRNLLILQHGIDRAPSNSETSRKSERIKYHHGGYVRT
jgi:hypothetical protein